MPTPISIPNAYIETFNNNVVHLSQQTTSRLRKSISEVNKQSEKHNWDFLASSVARKKTSARMVSPSGGDESGAVGTDFGLDWSRRQTIITVALSLLMLLTVSLVMVLISSLLIPLCLVLRTC